MKDAITAASTTAKTSPKYAITCSGAPSNLSSLGARINPTRGKIMAVAGVVVVVVSMEEIGASVMEIEGEVGGSKEDEEEEEEGDV
mmetsp:Transcript_25757/g.35985  ORF Transcript_25757/g.35985 Transcript_25757/m.35985 type:complete len:86 (+) Transcript_25757:601-858(+)